MAKSKPYIHKTGIEITASLYEDFRKLTIRYGVGHAVSGGIILLDRLSAQEREDLMDQVKQMFIADKAAYEDESAAARAAEADKRSADRRKNVKSG